VNIGRSVGLAAAFITLSLRAAVRPAGRLALRIASDQRRIRGFPLTALRDGTWKPALGVIGATAALIALDPLDTPWLQQSNYQDHPAVRKINGVLNAANMARVIYMVPLAFYIGGILLRNSYAWRTGLLALEAAADAEIISISMKHFDRRIRPIDVGGDGDFTRTWFRSKTFKLDGAGCFPSGHTASAFSVATVFARRYPGFSLAAYGIAGIIAASRLSTRAHFPSDVFFGAVLGHSISRHVVMQRDFTMTVEGHVTAGG
jgi:membrane-associated phospholipid phosphatase